MWIFRKVLWLSQYRNQELLGNFWVIAFLQAAREENRKISSLYLTVRTGGKKKAESKETSSAPMILCLWGAGQKRQPYIPASVGSRKNVDTKRYCFKNPSLLLTFCVAVILAAMWSLHNTLVLGCPNTSLLHADISVLSDLSSFSSRWKNFSQAVFPTVRGQKNSWKVLFYSQENTVVLLGPTVPKSYKAHYCPIKCSGMCYSANIYQELQKTCCTY